jgi:hypothetical protein
MNATRKMAVTVLSLGFVLTGCSSDKNSTTPSAATTVEGEGDPNAGKGEGSPGIAINPCTLLTAGEVGDALSVPVEKGVRKKQVCTWTSTKDEGVSLALTAYDRGRIPRESCDEYFGRADEMIKDLGIKAGYSEKDGLSAFTRSGDLAVEGIPACLVFDPTPPDQASVEDMKDLVKVILGRPPFTK